MNTDQDRPKSLGDERERATRHALLTSAHMLPLAHWVNELRHQMGGDYQVPHFDPLDGGTEAECLFVLEAPGPKAVASRFVSRNNPDETAKNFYLLNEAVGLDRRRTVTWNITPWYVGSGKKIRPVNSTDIAAGLPRLLSVISLLPRLRVIVLVGGKARRAEHQLRLAHPALSIVTMPHPSPMFVNRKPENRMLIRERLREVVQSLDSEPVLGDGALP